MPTHRQQEILALRAAYVTAHHHFKLNWIEISTLFRVNPSTACATYNRACNRAQSTELLEILKHLEDQPRTGREQLFPKGSKVSIAKAELSQMDQDHQDAPHRRITAEIVYHNVPTVPFCKQRANLRYRIHIQQKVNLYATFVLVGSTILRDHSH